MGRVTRESRLPGGARRKAGRQAERGEPEAVILRAPRAPDHHRTETEGARFRGAAAARHRRLTAETRGDRHRGTNGAHRVRPLTTATAVTAPARAGQVDQPVEPRMVAGAARPPTGPGGIAGRREAAIGSRRAAGLAPVARRAVSAATRRGGGVTGRRQATAIDPGRRAAPERAPLQGRAIRAGPQPVGVTGAARATDLPPKVDIRGAPGGIRRRPGVTTTGLPPRATGAARATDRRRGAGTRAARGIVPRPVAEIGNLATGPPRRRARPNGAADPVASVTDRASGLPPARGSGTTKAAPAEPRFPIPPVTTTTKTPRSRPAASRRVASGGATIPSGAATPSSSAGGSPRAPVPAIRPPGGASVPRAPAVRPAQGSGPPRSGGRWRAAAPLRSHASPTRTGRRLLRSGARQSVAIEMQARCGSPRRRG
jgi:hypothetical protein